MKSKHNISRQDKFNKICEYLSKEEMERMLKEGFSFGMIRDLLLRDYEQIKKEEMLTSTLATQSNFWRVLKDTGLEVNNELYLSKPQWWKIQFRFPASFSKEEIQNLSNKESKRGQTITIQKRRENGTLGNPKFKRESSPLCIEFYTSRGWSVHEAKKEIRQICSKGGVAALKSAGDSVVSGIEIKFAQMLEKLGVDYSIQKIISLNENERVFNYYYHSYDFQVGNSLIEIQGTYFHADPRFFKQDDEVLGKKAKEIWEKDAFKEQVAISRGYQLVRFWEHDVLYRAEEVEKKIKDLFLTNL